MSFNILLDSDSMLNLEQSDKPLYNRVNIVLDEFLTGRKNILSILQPKNNQRLKPDELQSIFLTTLVLVRGPESSYVKVEYKTLLFQLTYQLGFLVKRIHPEYNETLDVKKYLDSCYFDIMVDIESETQLLAAFLKNFLPLMDDDDNPLPIYHSFAQTELIYWTFNDITYVLNHLEDIGREFKAFLLTQNDSAYNNVKKNISPDNPLGFTR